MNSIIMDENVVVNEKLMEELRFDERGLIPAIVCDHVTKDVLMLAYMSKESLRISLEKGLTCFYSRSRDELWIKGGTSGNYQRIASITTDCDRDTLLVAVKPLGPACHLGTYSCFENEVYNNPTFREFSVQKLMSLLHERKRKMPENSYTTYLFEKGLDKILKKVGEECTEVIIAAKDGDKKETIYEIADLYYHLCVLMVEAKITAEDVNNELASRHIIDTKVKQEKMT